MRRSPHNTSRIWHVVIAFIAVSIVASASIAGAATYLGPIDVIASPDQSILYSVNTDGKQIAVFDVVAGKLTRSVTLPQTPTGLVVSPDGATLYVTCAKPEGTVEVLDAATAKIKASIPVGHSANAPSISPDGKRLYVCNRFDNDVSVIDTAAGKVIARVPTLREPVGSAITQDGSALFVTNLLPVDPADSYDVASEITVIDTATNKTTNIRLPNGSSGVHEICISPDGKYAYTVHILSRYGVPTTQLERGWVNTNALSILDVAEKKLINTVLLDDIDLGAANPYAVATTADGKRICVSHAGTHELSVIDSEALMAKLAAIPPDEKTAQENPDRYADRSAYVSRTQKDVPNDLAFLVGFRERIRLRPGGPWALTVDPADTNGPRGLDIVGSKVYIAVYFSDELAIVDLDAKPYNRVTKVPLGPKPKMTVQRRGQMLFHDAISCFQHWHSCATCHPDARVDALNWDLMNDGMGTPKNVRSMLLAHRTPPSMSSGIRPDAETAVRAGFERIQFTVPDESNASAVDEYLKSLKPVPSPSLVNGKLSEAAIRGKALFASKRINCAKCHPEPLYTDMQIHDVGSRGELDKRDDFDTPTLVEVWRTAPYMHDGHYTTLKDLFLKGKHGKKGGGDIDGLSEKELNDLIEFVKSL